MPTSLARRTPHFCLLLVISIVGCGHDKGSPSPDKGGESGDTGKIIAPTKRMLAEAMPGAEQRLTAGYPFLTADGKQFGYTYSSGKTLETRFFDISVEPKKLAAHPGRMVAFSPDGTAYLRDGNLHEIVNTQTGASTGSLKEPADAVFFVDKNRVVGVKRYAGLTAVRIYDHQGRMVGAFDSKDEMKLVTVAPANDRRDLVLALDFASKVRWYDLDTKKAKAELSLPNDSPPWAGFRVSPNGKWFAMKRGPKPLEIFDARTGAVAATISAPVNQDRAGFCANRDVYLTTLSVSRGVASGPIDIIAFDVNRRETVATFRGHESGITFLSLSDDGSRMVTTDERGEVMLWNLNDLP